jgi:hypothetical protein
MPTKIDRDVNNVLKTDEGRTLTELDYASCNRLLLLYIMLYVKQMGRRRKDNSFLAWPAPGLDDTRLS